MLAKNMFFITLCLYNSVIVPWEGYDDDVMALLIAHAQAMLLGVYLLLKVLSLLDCAR